MRSYVFSIIVLKNRFNYKVILDTPYINAHTQINSITDRITVTIPLYCITVAQPRGAAGARPLPYWIHKKIPGCAVELNTQNCAWFGSQISLITAVSFREAMPPRTTHQGLMPLDPSGDLRFPDPLCPPPPNPGCASGLQQGDAHCLLLEQNPDWFYVSGTSSPG